MKGEQQKVNALLVEDVMPFVIKHLYLVKKPVIAQVADRKKLADSFLDEETKKDIINQQIQYEQDKEKYLAQIQAQKEEFEKLMKK